MAVWMPVTVVPTSFATVAMDTFITELSSVMRNWAEARVSSTEPDAAATAAPRAAAGGLLSMGLLVSRSMGALIIARGGGPGPSFDGRRVRASVGPDPLGHPSKRRSVA